MGKEKTKNNEGLMLVVYDDATGRPIGPGSVVIGNPSIGWGINLMVPISEESAEFLFNERYAEATSDIWKIFTYLPVREMSEARKYALIDMRYQMGPSRFRSFRKMIEAVKAGDWSKAADECMDSDYGRDQRTHDRAQANSDALRNG